MRTVQAFILRLLYDSESPQALRGSLKAVERDEARPFMDEGELLALLRQAIAEAVVASPDGLILPLDDRDKPLQRI